MVLGLTYGSVSFLLLKELLDRDLLKSSSDIIGKRGIEVLSIGFWKGSIIFAEFGQVGLPLEFADDVGRLESLGISGESEFVLDIAHEIELFDWFLYSFVESVIAWLEVRIDSFVGLVFFQVESVVPNGQVLKVLRFLPLLVHSSLGLFLVFDSNSAFLGEICLIRLLVQFDFAFFALRNILTDVRAHYSSGFLAWSGMMLLIRSSRSLLASASIRLSNGQLFRFWIFFVKRWSSLFLLSRFFSLWL